MSMTEKLVRLSKLMSDRAIASRREADRLIEAGLVKVNGKVEKTLGVKVPLDAKVELLAAGRSLAESKVTILLNKPVGYVSNLPEKGYSPAIDLIIPENQWGEGKVFSGAHRHRLAVAGRLDIDSKGLLVMTQDGVTAKLLIGENSSIEKEYQVYVTGAISEQVLEKLRFGLSLDGKALKRAKIELRDAKLGLIHFTLREGKKRQIRRMCESVGLRVTGLKRVRIGRIRLGDLPEGKWRYLLSSESF